jgi:hypothetical protein
MVRSVVEAGRLGGQARARKLTPERRQQIAGLGWSGRADKRLLGVSKRELSEQLVAKIAEEDADLAWWIATAVKAPRRIGLTLIDLLNDRALLLVDRAFEEAIAEVSTKKGLQ